MTLEPQSLAHDTERATLVDIADRLSRLEPLVESLRQIVDGQTKRLTALQAQIDHLEAKRHSN